MSVASMRACHGSVPNFERIVRAKCRFLSRYANSSIYVPLLKRCVQTRRSADGRNLHDHLIRQGFERDVVVMNSLMEFYGKCRYLDDALHEFSQMLEKNIYSWTIIIMICLQHDQGHLGIKFFLQMMAEGILADEFTYATIVGAFTTQESLHQGMFVHACMVWSGFDHGAVILTALITMYGKCGKLELARSAFDAMSFHDSASWNSLIAAYAHHGHEKEALQLYHQMQRSGVELTEATFTAVLRACSTPDALGDGRDIHSDIRDGGFGSDFVKTALVSMYGNCGSLDEAQAVFHEIHRYDAVSVNAMLGAYIQNEHGKEALHLFGQMQKMGLEPTSITYANSLSSCALLGAAVKGMVIHMMVLECGLESANVLGTALLSMYGKCGALVDAWAVFTRMLMGRDCIAWNAMIAACAQSGDDKMVLHLFKQMQQDLVKPDGVTYLSVLLACSHSGSLQDARDYFDAMLRDHDIEPNPRHYACMIDLFGRAGLIDEAENFMKKMPFEPDAVVLTAFSGACKVRGDIVRGRWAAERLIDLDPQVDAHYIMLSHFYAAEGRWDDVAAVRQKMEQNVNKKAGRSWIEVDSHFHEFVSEDSSHPCIKDIYLKLDSLNEGFRHTSEAQDPVLNGLDKFSKQNACHHSERLAIAFGLLSSQPEKMIRVFNNERICPDCHAFTKSISKMVGREIVIRDADRFHHFTDGVCSCGDHW